MELVALKAVVRQGVGKEKAKKLRKEGFVPGVVYHRGEESVSVTVNEKELSRLLRTAGGDNVLKIAQPHYPKENAKAEKLPKWRNREIRRLKMQLEREENKLSLVTKV